MRGLTTAAALWYVSILGLVLGSGDFLLGLMGVGIALVILFVLPYIESYVKNDWYATVTITVQQNTIQDNEVLQKLEMCNLKVKKIDLDYNLQTKQKIFCCAVKFKKRNLLGLSQRVVHQLAECPGVLQVKWT